MEFRFYRPPSWVINPTIVFMVFLSIGCILIGSLWAAKEVKKELYKLKIINISSEIDVPKVNFIVDENQLRSTEIGIFFNLKRKQRKYIAFFKIF